MNPSLPFHNQRVTRLVQAYRQAPWRTQRQWIFIFLLAMVALGMVAGLYLNVTARAALAGRQVQVLEASIAQTQRANADLQTQIAAQLSSANMAQRAATLGFEPATPETLEYVVVDGYFPPQPVSMSPATSDSAQVAAIDPLYTQSLLQWLGEKIGASALP
jgi:cell division protein FtsL